jgi:integrase
VRWCEFDIKAASWNVPAERMKRPKPHYVALAPRALAILAEARALRPDAKPDDLVFPSRDPRKPLSEMAMLMMLRRIPTGEKRDDGEDETYSDLSTVHGFRAGFSSWAREKTRFRVDAIEAALAHREQDRVAAAYSHMAEYRKDRAALATAWAEFVASGTTKGKVIKMRARSA